MAEWLRDGVHIRLAWFDPRSGLAPPIRRIWRTLYVHMMDVGELASIAGL